MSPSFPSSLLRGMASAVVCSSLGCAEGQLGQTTFSDPCASSDAACSAGGSATVDDTRLPLAIGGRRPLVIRPDVLGALSAPLQLRPVAPDIIDVDGDVLIGNGEGIAAVLVVTDSGAVVDVVHVAVQKPQRMSLHRSVDGGAVVDERALPDAVKLFADEEINLRLGVYGGAQELAGDLGEAWAVDNPAFRLADQGFARERRLRAPAEGSGTLTVTLPTGLTTTIRFEVIP